MSKQKKAARAVGTKGMPRAEREKLILDAAAQEFGAKGYARGSTAVVAAQAGISKPMIYEYFGSKDGLYLTCLEHAGSRLVEAVAKAQKGPSDLTRAARTLEAIFRGWSHACTTGRLFTTRHCRPTGPFMRPLPSTGRSSTVSERSVWLSSSTRRRRASPLTPTLPPTCGTGPSALRSPGGGTTPNRAQTI